jgi:cholesterol oxidase
MFIMPEHENLVSHLHAQGFDDVWCLDFRMSNRHTYNLFKHRYTLDDVALYDFPPALETMRAHIGDRPIHVIAHCLGAASFAMSLFARVVEVDSVILNSVSLTPRVPGWSHWKLRMAPAMVDYVIGIPYLNPRASEDPGLTRSELVSRFVSLFHRECDVPACHMLSMMWGTGWPALYSHENLADVTHRRGGDLYGATSMNYYRHVRRMLSAGHAVKYHQGDPRYDRLPDSYFEYAAEIETPVLFMTGENNRVFAKSNIVCYERLEEIVPGRHELYIIPGYGHQDPFMGKDVAVDVFPRLVEYLNVQRERSVDRRRPALV